MSASPSVPDLTAPLTTPAPGRRAWWKYAVAAVIVIALLVAPLVLQVEANQQLARVGVFAVAVLGLNVIMGYTGQVSLGQIFFVGFGAYATAYGVNNDWPIVVTFIAAIVLPGIAGLFVAFAAARLGGLAIAMVTIALPVIGVPLAKRLSDLTGGSQGTSARFSDAPEWTGLADDQWQYYTVLLIAGICFILVANLTRGKFGRALAIVKENENVAKSMGISPYRYKVMSFTIAAMIGGVAGFLYMVVIQYTSPETLAFHHSINLLASMVVGGAASIFGSLLGGIYYVFVPSITNEIAPTLTALIQGVILLAVLIVLPGGLASVPHRIRRLFRGRRSADRPNDRADDRPSS
ncbi:branched-chain amino acid ABC transporter permease [Microbacterium sp. JB110]|uniref:branched-chain amino acid ABC transporter permease n=1 Tax=Microbacterium sp. JB110 TaxID=2024477 RepID=UPI00097EAB82|nr:branched-chain amino acid ABC transporter permease [Microbacterium sp. JB110]RCS61347.1 branched-chain amino acid ABC transporter permease [Microbacterium sp. JB110]SJM50606.1 Branched-chain amino acid transport system permease protein LivM (TC 3.A.1.4.1) [Frigoribacterium sp. JB110]